MSVPPAAVSLKHADRFFINGEWAKPSSSSMIDVINSGTEELFLRVAEAQEADVNRAVAAARAAFDKGPWPRMSHAERGKYLRAIAQEIPKYVDEMATIWTVESGLLHGMSAPLSADLVTAIRYGRTQFL